MPIKHEKKKRTGKVATEEAGGELHLVMEKLESRGDLHKEVTDARWWDAIRTNGEDTGARLRANYTMMDDDGDRFAYRMPWRLKLQLAEEFARGMLEMRGCNNTPDEATGFEAVTPGYQAPEVVKDGLFAPDMYSAGVSLIDIWAGDVWKGGEGYPGMRCEVLDALGKIHRADLKVAAVLRCCIAENAAHRPLALQLLKAFTAIKRSPTAKCRR